MDTEVMINPEKYGYVQCDHCNGYGSSLKEESDKCTKCGGSGLVRDIRIDKPVIVKAKISGHSYRGAFRQTRYGIYFYPENGNVSLLSINKVEEISYLPEKEEPK